MLPGKAFAMSLSSAVEFSESSVIIVAAIEGTASSSSWSTLRTLELGMQVKHKVHQLPLNGLI